MVRTTIMAEEETLKKIGQIAYKTGKSKAFIIREALTAYVADSEHLQEQIENPFLELIALAEALDDEDIDYEPIDWENGEGKKIYAEYLNEKYERAIADFNKRQLEKSNESNS